MGTSLPKKLVKAWLKAGYCAFPCTEVHETLTRIPQEGVISPLLANIALHGIEKVLRIKTVSTTGHNASGNSYAVIRYADNFLVLADSKEKCIQAKALLVPWLGERGLQFSLDKVHIKNLKEGIQFLGCHIKIYGKEKSTLLIKPDPESIKALRCKLKEIWLKHKGQATIGIIKELNPLIRGWANYYSPFVSSETFSSLDHFMWY